MNNNLNELKSTMKLKARTYNTYCYYLAIPVIVIAGYILAFAGMRLKSIGTITLGFTILANFNVSKLDRLSKKKYIAPILYYVSEMIGMIIVFFLFSNNFEAIGILTLFLLYPIQLGMVIFFFITANDVKNAYPNMKQEATEARQDYLNEKRNYKKLGN